MAIPGPMRLRLLALMGKVLASKCSLFPHLPCRSDKATPEAASGSRRPGSVIRQKRRPDIQTAEALRERSLSRPLKFHAQLP
jgi:hypothetical protein